MQYRTNDIGMAAYLFAEGLEIVSVDSTTPRYNFVFNITREQGLATENSWWTGALSVNPRVYFQGLEQIKDILHSTRRRLKEEELLVFDKDAATLR